MLLGLCCIASDLQCVAVLCFAMLCCACFACFGLLAVSFWHRLTFVCVRLALVHKMHLHLIVHNFDLKVDLLKCSAFAVFVAVRYHRSFVHCCLQATRAGFIKCCTQLLKTAVL